jgi:hypothetical protein
MEPGIEALFAISPSAIYIAFAVSALIGLTSCAIRRLGKPLSLNHARSLMASLDIDAFRNLVDPKEEIFLRSSLPAKEFLKIKRERAWAALAYTRSLSCIALHFSRFGNAARRADDAGLAELGKQMARDAAELRILALATMGRLLFIATFPSLSLPNPHSLIEQHLRSTGLLARYSILENARRQVASAVRTA